MIRCLPEDKTNGFFVACFVKAEVETRGNDKNGSAQRGDKKGKKRAREAEAGPSVGLSTAVDAVEAPEMPEPTPPSTSLAEPAADTMVEPEEVTEIKIKSDAQAERIRRKKQLQRQKKKQKTE